MNSNESDFLLFNFIKKSSLDSKQKVGRYFIIMFVIIGNRRECT